jgi:hypothetical protein
MPSLTTRVALLMWVNENFGLEVSAKNELSRLQECLGIDTFLLVMNKFNALTPRIVDSQFHFIIWSSRIRQERAKPAIPEQRRIGTGYRDKGTLQSIHSSARKAALQDSWRYSEPETRAVWVQIQIDLSLRESEGSFVGPCKVPETLCGIGYHNSAKEILDRFE